MGACCGMDQFTWMVVVAVIVGFVYAFGIGANDVANAFGSTVSSGSLTLKQAVMVATVMEFSGSFFLGAAVTSTIRSKIFDTKLYANEPEIVMLGMLTSLITGAVMLLVATAYAMPVSTTHTIVGCIMGFSIAAKGFNSIQWDVVGKIALSWLISPLSSGVVGFLLFFCVQRFILMSPKPFDRSYVFFPLILFIFVAIDVFYVINKGLNNTAAKNLKVGEAIGIGCAFGAGAALLWLFVLGPWAKGRIETLHPETADDYVAPEADPESPKNVEVDTQVDVDVKEDSEIEEIDVDSFMEARAKARAEGKSEADIKAEMYTTTSKVATSVEKPIASVPDVVKPTAPVAGEPSQPAAPRLALAAEPKPEPTTAMGKWYRNFADNTFDQDLHQQSFEESKRAEEIWAQSDTYDFKSERLFTYVQVFTACLNSFAHGANDVANAIAPISAIFLIWENGTLKSSAPVQKWILAYGGVGIVAGLLLYGYKVIKTIGFKMTMLSPSRGACAELGASLVVVTASYLEIPVSSTQCICGSVSGVGLVGGIKNVQWLLLLKVSISWVVIFFLSSVLSGLMFAMFAYSPTLTTPIPDPTKAPTKPPTLAPAARF